MINVSSHASPQPSHNTHDIKIIVYFKTINLNSCHKFPFSVFFFHVIEERNMPPSIAERRNTLKVVVDAKFLRHFIVYLGKKSIKQTCFTFHILFSLFPSITSITLLLPAFFFRCSDPLSMIPKTAPIHQISSKFPVLFSLFSC